MIIYSFSVNHFLLISPSFGPNVACGVVVRAPQEFLELKSVCTCVTRAERTKLNGHVLYAWLNVKQVQVRLHVCALTQTACFLQKRKLFSSTTLHLGPIMESKTVKTVLNGEEH